MIQLQTLYKYMELLLNNMIHIMVIIIIKYQLQIHHLNKIQLIIKTHMIQIHKQAFNIIKIMKVILILTNRNKKALHQIHIMKMILISIDNKIILIQMIPLIIRVTNIIIMINHHLISKELIIIMHMVTLNSKITLVIQQILSIMIIMNKNLSLMELQIKLIMDRNKQLQTIIGMININNLILMKFKMMILLLLNNNNKFTMRNILKIVKPIQEIIISIQILVVQLSILVIKDQILKPSIMDLKF